MTDKTTLNDSIMKNLATRVKELEKKMALLDREVKDIKGTLANYQSSSSLMYSRSYSTKRLGEDSDDSCDNSVKKAKVDDSKDFNRDGDYVVVFTDGACENNGRPNAKAGIGVWFGENHPLNVSQPVNGRATNNTAEIQACIQAIQISHNQGVKKLKIKTDSQFVISSITQWIHNWKKNNWKVKSGGAVKNKEDFMALDKACSLLVDIKWEHVDGHSGLRGNEEADKLARNGALTYVKSL